MTQTTIVGVLKDPMPADVLMTSHRDMVTGTEHIGLHGSMSWIVLAVSSEVMAGVDTASVTIGEFKL